jgi:peptide/nickel transport system substrate-binding protein
MRLAAGILAIALAAAMVACNDPAEPAAEITIARAVAPATLDPALASDRDTLEALWLVYTPLLTYRHTDGASGEELIAGLATDLPEVSDDGATYALTLRKDLTYSDGTPAVASDFKRAVDRALSLDSPAAAYLREIADISADDATGEITIRLRRPDVSFPYVLALPATAPVPVGTQTHDLKDDPPPGIGPYELDTSSGDLALVRSDSFAGLEIPDIPQGNLGRIDIKVEPSSIQRTTQVLDNEVDSIQGLPDRALEAQIASRASDRYAESPGLSTTYALLNRHRAPFDDPLVREAVRDGVDSTGCSLIPAGMPGYDHDFDTGNCDHSVGRARAVIQRAGATGTPVTVGYERGDPGVGPYVKELRAIGLAAIRKPSGPTPTTLITHWAETPQPFDFFDEVRDEPEVASRLDALRLDPNAGDWAELERYVLAPPQANLVPLSHERVTTLFSTRMDPESAYVHPIFGNDLTSWRIKEGS